MPGHAVLKLVKEGDYRAFYEREIALRRSLNYPPCGWMVLFAFTARKEEKALQAAQHFLTSAQTRFAGVEWLGPTPAYRPKLKDRYRFQIVLKAPRKARGVDSRMHVELRELIKSFRSNLTSGVHFAVDVDPVQLL